MVIGHGLIPFIFLLSQFYVLCTNLHKIGFLWACLSCHPTTYKLWEVQVAYRWICMGGTNMAAKTFYLCPDKETHIPEFFRIMHVIRQNSSQVKKLKSYARNLMDRQFCLPGKETIKLICQMKSGWRNLCQNHSRWRNLFHYSFSK